MEIWKDIKGYEGLYKVSNFGRIKSFYHNKEKILILGSNSSGYAIVGLWKNGTEKFYSVHRIVAIHFIPNCQNKFEVNHIDGNKKNNNVENLEWVSKSENMKHAVNTGLLHIKHYVAIPKEIEQFDLNNQFIKCWESCKQIVNALGFADSHIYDCCKNKRKTAYGYIWKYKKELVNNLDKAN